MAAELIRVDAAINLLLASVGHTAEYQQLPSEKLSVYIRAKNAELQAENLDLGDAMQVIGAVANLVKMFNGVV